MSTLTANYYDVLEVSPAASLKEIRASFRRLVLLAHPDKNPDRLEWSEKRIRELIEAFEVVGNAERRAQFDLRFRHQPEARKRREKPFYYYKRDPGSRALLILHHLLERRADRAVDVLVAMEVQFGCEFLAENLERADYLDCLFLLGEHYTAKRQYLEAARRLHAFYEHERRTRYPRHYMEEVVRRLKNLYLKKLPRHVAPEDALRGLELVEGLGLTRAEQIERLRKLAVLNLRLGNLAAALRTVRSGLRLAPRSSAFIRLEEKIREKAMG